MKQAEIKARVEALKASQKIEVPVDLLDAFMGSDSGNYKMAVGKVLRGLLRDAYRSRKRGAAWRCEDERPAAAPRFPRGGRGLDRWPGNLQARCLTCGWHGNWRRQEERAAEENRFHAKEKHPEGKIVLAKQSEA